MNLIETGNDVTILLTRALIGKQFYAFGEDGCGKYGRSAMPIQCTIKLIRPILRTTSTSGISCSVELYLDGYSAAQYGEMTSDLNALIGIRQLLVEHSIDPASVAWPDSASNHGGSMVTLDVDVDLLLDWR